MKYRAYRWPSEGNVRIRVGNEELWAVINNVNTAGLCATCNGILFPSGHRMVFSVPGFEIGARVIWALFGRIGVKFDCPINEAQLALIRNIAVSQKTGHRPLSLNGKAFNFAEMR